MNNLIILGAGASFGSGGVYFGNLNSKDRRTPLGNELYSELCKFQPKIWNKIPEEPITNFTSNFESGMVRLINADYDIALLQKSLAEYFFNFFVGKDNLYTNMSLLIKDSHWKGAFITLNYERLLFQALVDKGIQPVCGSQLSNINYIEVCLPHGCCNLFCDGLRASRGIRFRPEIATSGRMKVIDDPAEFEKRIKEDSLPPVMSYYEPMKRTLSGRNFIDAQRARMKELISNAERIAIVGVSYRQHDGHIWEPLRDTKAEILCCSNGDSTIEEWNKTFRKNKPANLLSCNFVEGFNDIMEFVQL